MYIPMRKQQVQQTAKTNFHSDYEESNLTSMKPFYLVDNMTASKCLTNDRRKIPFEMEKENL